MLKLPLELNPYKGIVSWKTCAPFLDNPRALLIHRPRMVEIRKVGGKYPAHMSIHNYCGSTFSGKKFTFHDTLSEDGKLLCTRCEAAAIQAGLPSASEIVGRHVHLGRVIPIKVCCEEGDDNEVS